MYLRVNISFLGARRSTRHAQGLKRERRPRVVLLVTCRPHMAPATINNAVAAERRQRLLRKWRRVWDNNRVRGGRVPLQPSRRAKVAVTAAAAQRGPPPIVWEGALT